MINNINSIISKYDADPTRLMDILIDVQHKYDCISDEAVTVLADKLKLSEVDIEQTLSFYHFLSKVPRGKFTVYLNNSAVAGMFGREAVARAFEESSGCTFGEVSSDGLIGLFDTSCIGMNDQEPAAIINGTVFTRLTPFRVREIVSGLRKGLDPVDLQDAGLGDGNNSLDIIGAVVNNNIMKVGPVLSRDYKPGEAIRKIIQMTPEEVIKELKHSNIRGRGGAGFPTALKWEFCRNAPGSKRYIFCNADEGEPGTFKDRVILTELPLLLFEGMVVSGYAIGAHEGILYLRYEYKYLQKFLESILKKARRMRYLGKNILGKEGFDFDIRIQFGAGAYVCGEESALIESAEGKRGEPRDRPPFPVEKGYLNQPTVVNNVETLCAAVKVVLKGGEWYRKLGTHDSTGTKLLSVSGDCRFPGVYEVEWGFNVNQILEMVGAQEVQAVQVGGPSGTCVGPDDFNRTLCYTDLATGGSLIIIGKNRDLLRDIILNFTDFFIEESCGSCTPCRVLTVMMRNKLLKILDGKGCLKDLDDFEDWGKLMRTNRCGLGHTAPNPILSSLKNFRHLYEQLIPEKRGFDTGFRIEEALAEGRSIRLEQLKLQDHE